MDLLDSLDRVTGELVASVDPSDAVEERYDVEALSQHILERQHILDALQKADTSSLSSTERARMTRCIEAVIRKDESSVVTIRKCMKEIEKSSGSLAQARRAVTGYRPVPSDDARPLRSIV